jgi:hypothetical protein
MSLEEKIAECLDKKIDEVEEYTGLHGDDLAKEIMKIIKEFYEVTYSDTCNCAGCIEMRKKHSEVRHYYANTRKVV